MSQRSSRAERRAAEWPVLVLLGVVFALAGCHTAFKPRNYANPEALFRASLMEYQRKNWENAQLGFEQLSNDLSARDPLLPQVLYYLALTHEKRSEFLLASQAYQRVSDAFADDSLAPAAVLGAGRSLQKMWRKSVLDPEQGQKAATTLRMLLATYPTSKQAVEAKERLDTLDNWFAKKDYDVGIHYLKVRNAPDPAIIYFKDVVSAYPNTAVARLAWLRLHDIYQKRRWKDDASDVCAALWKSYVGDA
ncbi:MAG: outer membrane protein assembly factor BamD, partial [Gemmatimonadota bacterium]|nr:outer membrane protein assembly factor BamD [Gemmatimonadota bacterium]